MLDLGDVDLPQKFATPSPTEVYSSWVTSLPGLEGISTVDPGGLEMDENIILKSWPDEFDPGASVPEPLAWAMFITGFAAIGTALRRRRARNAEADAVTIARDA